MTDVEWKYASVDASGGNQTIETVPCLLKGVIVVTSPSAKFVVADDAVDVLAVKAGAAVGDGYDAGDVRIETSLKVECSGTGLLTVLYRRLNELYQ